MSGGIYNLSFYHSIMGDSSMELFQVVIIISNLDVFSATQQYSESELCVPCISNHLKAIIKDCILFVL